MQSRGDALTQTFHICAAAAKMRGNRRWKGACDGQTVVTDEAAEPIDVDERQSSWSDGRSLQPVKLTKQWSDFYYRAGGIYSGKRNATVWRPSVRPSLCILTVTHQRAACDAASAHFGPTIWRTDIHVSNFEDEYISRATAFIIDWSRCKKYEGMLSKASLP